MMDWLARARAQFVEMAVCPTDKTDESPLLSVLSVPAGRIYKFPDRLSSVSSVGIWAVFENTALSAALIEAAMRACDAHGDSEAARKEMHQQCMELTPELQADLLEHFLNAYPAKNTITGEMP